MSETENKTSDPLATARKRFALAKEAMEENRASAEEANKFSAGLEQWPDELRREREEDRRPCLVMDETNQYINQIKNDQRQNKAAIKVRPVDDKADKKVAEMLQGVIRNIEDQSSAEIAYDTAFEHALRGGFGYWRVYTEYEDENSFNQEIRIGRIRDRFSVYLDPEHQEPDGSDSRYGFITQWMNREDFKRDYPKFDPIDWRSEQREFAEWANEESVRIADYFFIREEQKTIVQLPDGSSADESELLGVNTEGLRKRTTTTRKVIWQKITGKEVIEETEWMGKYIPIIEVLGNESEIDGKRQLTGIVHSAMDAQRMHNFAISAMVENVALAPKSPFIAAVGQLEGFENQWKDANRRNIAVLPYHPISVDGVSVPAPQRQPPPGLSQGWSEIVMASRMWIQAAMGMYNASVGAPSNEKSGKAILARQREGDVSSFHYHDNLARSIRHTGRILVDLIPKIYDTKRVIRILGEDGKPETVMFDPDMQSPSQQSRTQDGSPLMLYNPTIGKYDITVSTGPSYTTKRQEAAETQMQMIQAAPNLMPIVGDIMIRNMDWPQADQIADRLKAMLPPPIKELEQQPDEGSLEAKAMQLQQAEQQLMQKAQTLFDKEQQLMQGQKMLEEAGQATAEDQAKLEAIKVQLEALKKDIEHESQLLTSEKARISAEIRLAEANAMAKVHTQQMDAEKAEETGEQDSMAMMGQAVCQMAEKNAQATEALVQAVNQLTQVTAAQIVSQQPQI